MPGEVVRIVNTGETDFVDMYDSNVYRIPAGGQSFVDFDVMCLWLGHPAANNFDPRNRVRVQEYQRLRIRYGVEARSLELSEQHVPHDTDELFKDMRPPLEVFDVNGTPILTVADDPDGNLLAPPDESKTSDMGVIMARLQQMEQEQQNLRAQLARYQAGEMSRDEAQPIPTDTSGMAPPIGTQSNIPGSVTVPSDPDQSTQEQTAPRPPARSEPGDDSPTRVRVSGA